MGYLRNRKQGYNLIFEGYMYKKEAIFRSTINWICSHGNGKRFSENKCLARCITKWEGGIKLSKKLHNHPRKYNMLPLSIIPPKIFQQIFQFGPLAPGFMMVKWVIFATKSKATI